MQGKAGPTVVLAKVQQLAFYLVSGYLPARGFELGHRLGALAADVHHRGVRVEHHLPARCLDALAVVDFFVIQKETGVEQPDLVEDLTAHQVETPRQPIAFAHRPMVPAHVINALYAGDEAFQAGAGKKHVERCRKIPAARLQAAIATFEPNTQHATLRVRLHVVQGLVQRVLGHESVGVEQQGVLTLQVGQQLIVGTAKPYVLPIAQHQRLRADLGQAGK